MLIPRLFENCVGYAFQDTFHAEQGLLPSGTGFLVANMISDVQPFRAFIVTNRHVVEHGFTTFRFTNRLKQNIFFQNNDSDWVFPEDNNIDLAILSLGGRLDHVSFISLELMLGMKDMMSQDFYLGEDVAIIGLHINIHGTLTNSPTARFGYLAQYPSEPICDDSGRNTPLWLIQCPTIPGFSGSPVLIQRSPLIAMHESNSVQGWTDAKTWLLGVHCSGVPFHAPTVLGGGTRNPSLHAEVSSGLSGCLPAWHVRNLIRNEFGVG